MAKKCLRRMVVLKPLCFNQMSKILRILDNSMIECLINVLLVNIVRYLCFYAFIYFHFGPVKCQRTYISISIPWGSGGSIQIFT